MKGLKSAHVGTCRPCGDTWVLLPELVPMLNWVVLRINVLGSEQKSLRAWRGVRVGRAGVGAARGQMRDVLAEAPTD